MQGVKQMVDGGLAHAVVGNIAPDQPGALQDPCDVQQLPGVQAAPHVCPLEGPRHRLHPGKGGAAPEDHHLHRGGGLLQPPGHLVRVSFRTQLPGPALALLGHRLGGQQLQDPGKLQGLDGFFKQISHWFLPQGGAGPLRPRRIAVIVYSNLMYESPARTGS